MQRERPSIITRLSRCLRLRCPACGYSSIFHAPFKIKHHCSSCRALFAREDGYFVGAISVNVVTTEFVILAIYILCLLTVGINDQLIFTILIPVALLFPLAFYHYSWSIWLSFDHFFEPLPKYMKQNTDEG